MSRKALLAGLIEQNPNLPGELAKVAVAADLAILVAESGINRSDLAKKLGWTRARVSQVLSGQGNLTIETMHAVAKAVGSSFDVVFRKPAGSLALQPWQQNAALQLPMSDEPELPNWMSRADDHEMRALLAAIDHRATHRAVSIERAFTRALGGTCHSPVAALAELTPTGVRFRAEILSADGAERIAEDRIIAGEAEAEALAAELLNRASPATRALFDR